MLFSQAIDKKNNAVFNKGEVFFFSLFSGFR